MRNRASAAGSRDRSSRRKYSDTNRSSPVKPAALAALGAPACIDSAARYRPAGQPSVRSVSSESSLASSSTPAASSSNPASCSSSRRSATPISSTHPCARQRASGRAGSSLLAIAICEPAGTYSNSVREHVQTGRIGDRVQIVEHQHQRALERGQRAPEPRDACRPGGSPRAGQRVEHLGRERLDTVDRRRDVAQEHDRRRRLARRARPTRTDADQPRPSARAASSCRSRRARPRSRDGEARRAQPRDDVRLRHRARAGQRRSELDLQEVEGNVRDGHRVRSYEGSDLTTGRGR